MIGWPDDRYGPAPTPDAELRRIADETGETIEIVRDLADAMACCADEGPAEARVEREQAMREAFYDTFPAPVAGGTMPTAAEANAAIDALVETALRVRVDVEVCEAACEAAGIGPGNRDRMKPIIEAAFRAAGFEVEQ